MPHTTTKISSKGMKLQAEIASVFVQVMGNISIRGTGGESLFFDATELDSDHIEDGEPIGLEAPGEITGEGFIDLDDPGQEFMHKNKSSVNKVNWKVILRNGKELPFIGKVKMFDFAGQSKEAIKFNWSIKLASPLVYPDAE